MKKRARDRDGDGAGDGENVHVETTRQLRRKTIVSAQNRNRCERLVDYSSHEPLHDHGLLVVTLGFLADGEAPSELLEISVSCKSFRAAALDNIIWREMCDQKWKTKFGYRFRMDRAKTDAKRMVGGDNSEFDLFVSSSSEIRPYPTAMSDDIDCPKAGFWYHRYWNELKMATVNRITLSDLREWQWSACMWFILPSDDEPTVHKSGLWKPVSSKLRFLENGTLVGGNQVPSYQIQDNGSIVNTGIEKRCPVWALNVHRLSNWGWELRSQYFSIRAFCRNAELELLWADYQKELIRQDKDEAVPNTRTGGDGTTSRIVPRSMADKLEW